MSASARSSSSLLLLLFLVLVFFFRRYGGNGKPSFLCLSFLVPLPRYKITNAEPHFCQFDERSVSAACYSLPGPLLRHCSSAFLPFLSDHRLTFTRKRLVIDCSAASASASSQASKRRSYRCGSKKRKFSTPSVFTDYNDLMYCSHTRLYSYCLHPVQACNFKFSGQADKENEAFFLQSPFSHCPIEADQDDDDDGAGSVLPYSTMRRLGTGGGRVRR